MCFFNNKTFINPIAEHAIGDPGIQNIQYTEAQKNGGHNDQKYLSRSIQFTFQFYSRPPILF